MGECKICGRKALPGKDVCMNCTSSHSQRQHKPERGSGGYQRRGSGGGGPKRSQPQLPSECKFTDSFYAEDGHIKREVLLESAEKAAYAFQDAQMTQTSLRQLFNALKSIQQRLRADKSLAEGFLRENFLKFVSHVEYQTRRRAVHLIFRDFVNSHRELVISNRREFHGFVDYLTSIMCRMKK